tara:strand:+ start:689 stop:2605 length:1917 start_codon:yes stop_codon:yes gene_type:complete
MQSYLDGQVQNISYSEFRNLVAQGAVHELSIGSESITGKVYSEEGEQSFVVNRVEDPGLVERLDESGVVYSGKVESTWFTTLLSWILPAVIFVGIWMIMARRMGGGSGGLMSIGKSKAKVYMEKGTGITFDDVAGIDEAKEELEEVVEFLKTPERFQALGGRIPRGVLLVGPPGTGKTLLAKAVAGQAEVPFFSISGSDFVEMFVGVGAARVRDLFEQAKKHAPAIIFIDELDALGKARGVGSFGGHDEREQTLNQLLTELDGFETNVGIILMAATNRPEILDPALLRPGRFDRTVTVDRPDVKGREAILGIHAKEAKLSEEVDLKKVAVRTPGFAGADLANVINEAALLAARRDKQSITMDELSEAVERAVAGLERKSRVLNEKERRIVAYHEAGHAIVGEVLENANPVQKISIIPRGVGALGYTLNMPTEDRYLMTKEELLDNTCALLGGRAAEEIVFAEISTGASNDLQKATQIAESMVKEYGMSDAVGLVAHREDRQQQFMGMPNGDRNYSEDTAKQIDQEVARIIDESYLRAKDVLVDHRNVLEEVVKVLFEKEIMEGEELRMFLGGANAEAEAETTGPIQTDGNETEPDRGSSGNGSPYNEGEKQDVSETMDRKFPGNTDSVASDHDEQGTT